MFERYTEKARRVIFFARYEASQFGSPSIETEHLLLGILREDKALAHRFLGTTSSESIRAQIEARTSVGEKIPTSVDLPLSHECKRVLAYGAEEGKRLHHEHLGTEHLLLGLLREEKCFAAGMLHERGLQFALVRDKVASGGSTISDPSDIDKFRNSLVGYLTARQKEWGVTVALEPRVGIHKSEIIRVYAGEPAAARSPFLCIEVISSDDRFRELHERIDDYLSMGVRYVWLLDPTARRAYVATAVAGLREMKNTVLRTDNPAFDLPLDAVFT
jgi:putative restriction endonuclease/ClpA/ClpB-like protein